MGVKYGVLISNKLFKTEQKSAIEKVHLRLCKYYLGVYGKATNIACRAELGRFPLKLLINLRILKYFVLLNDLLEDLLPKRAFIMSKSLSDAQAVFRKCDVILLILGAHLDSVQHPAELICKVSVHSGFGLDS